MTSKTLSPILTQIFPSWCVGGQVPCEGLLPWLQMFPNLNVRLIQVTSRVRWETRVWHRRGRFLEARARCGLGLKVCVWCVYVQMSLVMRKWGRWWHQIGHWFCVSLKAEVAFSRSGSTSERGRSHVCGHHSIAPCAKSKGPDRRGCQGLPLVWLVTLTELSCARVNKYSHTYKSRF